MSTITTATSSGEWTLVEPEALRPMYPSLEAGGAQAPSQAPQPSHSGTGGASYYPTVGTASLRGSEAATGQQAELRGSQAALRPQAPNGASQLQTPLLRVQIDEQFRTHPPVSSCLYSSSMWPAIFTLVDARSKYTICHTLETQRQSCRLHGSRFISLRSGRY